MSITDLPVVVEMSQFVGELLVVVGREARLVVDYVVHSGGDSSLTDRLTYQIKVVALLSGHHSIDNGSRDRILFALVGESKESGADSFGDDNEGERRSLLSEHLIEHILDLSQFEVVNVLNHSFGDAVPIYHYLFRKSIAIAVEISLHSLWK